MNMDSRYTNLENQFFVPAYYLQVVYGNVCVVCKTTIQTEEEYIVHSQQHCNPGTQLLKPDGTNQVAMSCIVCRQTLVSLLELRLHARHHFQQPQPPLHLAAGLPASAGGSGSRSSSQSASSLPRYVCCVCLAQFDSVESVVARPGGYFVCVGCSCRDGLVVFDGNTVRLVAQSSTTGSDVMQQTTPAARSYQCIKCHESFANENDIRAHVTSHVVNEGNIHQCRLCVDVASSSTDERSCSSPGSPFVIFDSPAKLQAHIVMEHEFGGLADSASTLSAEWHCLLCGVLLSGPTAARNHCLEHRPSTWPHACPACPLRFFFAAELRNHQLVTGHRVDHGPVSASVNHVQSSPTRTSPSPDPADDLRCPECSRVFSGYASLCSHRRVHEKSAMLPAVAMVTDSSNDSAGRLPGGTPCNSTDDDCYDSNHVTAASSRDTKSLKVTPNTPLQCPECSRQFPSLSSLQGHMRVHNSGLCKSARRVFVAQDSRNFVALH